MQQLFAHHRGDETLPTTTVQGDFNPLWWVATVTEGDDTVFFKVINSGNSTVLLTLDFDRRFAAINSTTIISSVFMTLNKRRAKDTNDYSTSVDRAGSR